MIAPRRATKTFSKVLSSRTAGDASQVGLRVYAVKQYKIMTYGNADHSRSDTDCSRCPLSGCPAKREPASGELSGWGFALASLGLFLSPVVLAIAGAAYCGPRGEAQFFGAVLGLAVGMAASLAVAARARRNTGYYHDNHDKSGG